MLRKLYDTVIALAESPKAGYWLAAVSFAESSFFPIPPDTMLVPMALAKPEKAWTYATICTVASVLGGILGYIIGAVLYDSVGQWLISAYGYGKRIEEFRQLYQTWGHWIILIKGLTPIPYKIVTIASGIAGYSLPMFIVLSVLTRGLRFFAVAGILSRFGPQVRRFIEGHLGLVAATTLVFIVAGFFIARYMV